MQASGAGTWFHFEFHRIKREAHDVVRVHNQDEVLLWFALLHSFQVETCAPPDFSTDCLSDINGTASACFHITAAVACEQGTSSQAMIAPGLL